MKALGQCPHLPAQPSKHLLPNWRCGYSTENPKNMNSFSLAPSSILASQACRKTSLSLKCLSCWDSVRRVFGKAWHTVIDSAWSDRKVPHQNLYFSKFYTNSLGLKLDCDCFLKLGLSRSLSTQKFYFSEHFFPVSSVIARFPLWWEILLLWILLLNATGSVNHNKLVNWDCEF